MARTIDSPASPRVSTPDIPDELAPGRPGRRVDLRAARLDLTGDVDLAYATLEQCVVTMNAGTVDLTGATVLDVDMADIRAASLNLRGAGVRRLRIRGGRVGTLDLSGCRIGELELRDMRIDYLTLGGAQGDDIRIADCTIRALDMPQAQLKRVDFERTRADEVDPRGLRATDVDLRGLDALAYLDTNSLRGTTMSVHQATLLATTLAASAGIRITG